MAKENGSNKFYVLGFSHGTGIYTLSDDGKVERKDLERDGRERLLRFSLVAQQVKWLQKEILTIAEATIEDSRKLEATKKLIKDKFSAKISWIYELCGMPNEQDEFLDDDEECICTAKHDGPCESAKNN